MSPRYGLRDPAKAAAATISSIDSVPATAFIGAPAGVARAPVLNATSCRRMYDGDRPASGGTNPTPRSDGP